MNDPKVIKVTIEKDNGEIIQVEGKEAEKWQSQIHTGAMMCYTHGFKFEPLGWQTIRAATPVPQP